MEVKRQRRRRRGLQPRPYGWGNPRRDYKYPSGHKDAIAVAGFSPRATALTVYLVDDVARYDDRLTHPRPYTTGKACLYIKRLSDRDIDVLTNIITLSYINTPQHTKMPCIVRSNIKPPTN